MPTVAPSPLPEPTGSRPAPAGDIVQRLRNTASKGISVWGDMQMEAADTIQALRAQVEELQARAAFVISDLAILANRHICEHEETYRGGAIWEICSACGQKWADDRGGKPKFTEPPAMVNAYRFLKDAAISTATERPDAIGAQARSATASA